MVPNHKPPGFAGKHTPESYNIIQHGDEQQFETLRGYPGVVLEPMPWSLAQELIDQHTEDSLGQLGRHPLQLRTYMTFRDKLLEQWAGVDHYVRHKVYGFPTQPNSDGRLTTPIPQPLPNKIVFRPNDFPYYFQPGIEHYNLWSTQPLTKEEVQHYVEQHVAEGVEWMVFENPPALMSIPSMWHVHILTRAKAVTC